MEIIRKKICFDKSLSHRNGLVPFYEKESENHELKYVTGGDENGNYGSFACDFVLISATTITNGNLNIDEMVKEELSRLRYKDIIRKFNFTKEKIKNCFVLKKAKYVDSTLEFFDCVHDRIETTETEKTKWITSFVENVNIFEEEHCEILDSFYFIFSPTNEYILNDVFVDIRNTVQTLLDNGEEVSDENMKIYNDINHIQSIESDDNIEYGIVIDGYDEILIYENEWINWWENGWSICTYSGYYDRWEKYVFDSNYVEPVRFKFFKDVEKYILGIIHVPEEFNGNKIEGKKVPEIITSLTFSGYKTWFSNNELAVHYNQQLRKEWNERGGDSFFDFLNSLTPTFINPLQEPTHGNEIYFTYSAPNVDISLQFDEDLIYESEYTPYEYSVDMNGNFVDGTSSYSVPQQGIGSALTPSYQTYEDQEIICESKLGDLVSSKSIWVSDDINGVFNEFVRGCCLFKCIYCEGQSSVSQIRQITHHETYRYIMLNGELVFDGIDTEETIDEGIIQEESLPGIINSGIYQVVGIEKIGVISDNVLINTEVENVYMNGDNNVIAEKYTRMYYETINEYSWWECQSVRGDWSLYEVADGETIIYNGTEIYKYKNALILSCIPYLVNDMTVGVGYYFMARYDNGNVGNWSIGEPINNVHTIKSLDIPYVVGEKTNIQTFEVNGEYTTIYDEIISKTVDNETGSITIEYVKGKTSGATTETGIKYRETYGFSGNCCETVLIDGIYEGELYYNKLFKGEGTEVYNDDYNLKRNTYLASIIGMEIGTQWTDDCCVNAPLITQEMTDGLIDTPNISVSISYDRGAAAAWENHFKLSECNTLEDLENYGNGTFFNS